MTQVGTLIEGYRILISIVIHMTIVITIPTIQDEKKKKISMFYLFALYKLATKLFEAALGDEVQGKRWRQLSLLSCI